MELTPNEILIIVAGHKETTEQNLGQPFMEICVDFQSKKPLGYSHYLAHSSVGMLFPEAWSEVAILVEMKSFLGDKKFIGLQHYRRFFMLREDDFGETCSMPANMRNDYVKNQSFLLNQFEGKIIIPKKWIFDEDAFSQLITCQPTLEELTLLTLDEFDKSLKPIFGKVSSLKILKEKNYIYPLNMFMGGQEFYDEWRSILVVLIPKIEELSKRFNGLLVERWGGYIAERLFSIYITLCKETGRWNFIEKTVIVFDGPHKQQDLKNRVFSKEFRLLSRLRKKFQVS